MNGEGPPKILGIAAFCNQRGLQAPIAYPGWLNPSLHSYRYPSDKKQEVQRYSQFNGRRGFKLAHALTVAAGGFAAEDRPQMGRDGRPSVSVPTRGVSFFLNGLLRVSVNKAMMRRQPRFCPLLDNKPCHHGAFNFE